MNHVITYTFERNLPKLLGTFTQHYLTLVRCHARRCLGIDNSFVVVVWRQSCMAGLRVTCYWRAVNRVDHMKLMFHCICYIISLSFIGMWQQKTTKLQEEAVKTTSSCPRTKVALGFLGPFELPNDGHGRGTWPTAFRTATEDVNMTAFATTAWMCPVRDAS